MGRCSRIVDRVQTSSDPWSWFDDALATAVQAVGGQLITSADPAALPGIDLPTLLDEPLRGPLDGPLDEGLAELALMSLHLASHGPDGSTEARGQTMRSDMDPEISSDPPVVSMLTDPFDAVDAANGTTPDDPLEDHVWSAPPEPAGLHEEVDPVQVPADAVPADAVPADAVPPGPSGPDRSVVPGSVDVDEPAGLGDPVELPDLFDVDPGALTRWMMDAEGPSNEHGVVDDPSEPGDPMGLGGLG